MATAKTPESEPDVLDSMAKAFGIVTVAPENLPPAPRVNDRDDARWQFLEQFLPEHKGEWFKVKQYAKPGSASVYASQVNNNKNGRFPNDKYEARYTKTAENSTLYLRHRA